MMMRNLLLLSILSMLFGFSAKAQNKAREGNEILWSVDRQLTWDDFKGSNSNAKNNQAAYVGTRISIETKVNKSQDSVFVTIEAYMVKNKSWKLKTMNSDYCLKHEQLHFDMTELFARKFRKQVSEMIPDKRTFNDQLNKMLKKIDKALNAMQKLYDRETNHSLIVDKQGEWDSKIAQELITYDSWKETKLGIAL